MPAPVAGTRATQHSGVRLYAIWRLMLPWRRNLSGRSVFVRVLAGNQMLRRRPSWVIVVRDVIPVFFYIGVENYAMREKVGLSATGFGEEIP